MIFTAKMLGMRRDNRGRAPQPAAMRRCTFLVRVIMVMLAIGMAPAAHAVCTGLKAYSTTPAANTASPPCGWPNSNIMQPGQVDDSARQNMADTRAWYDDAQWINPGYPVKYVSGTAFEVSATNPSIYHLKRRIKVDDGSGNLTYGTIVSVTDISPVTAGGNSRTVILAPDSGSVAAGLVNVWFGAVSAISSSIVSSTLGLDVLGQPFQLISGTTQMVTNPAGISTTIGGVAMASFTTAGLTVSGTVTGTNGVFTSIGAGSMNMSGNLNVSGTLIAPTISGTLFGTVSATNLKVSQITHAVLATAVSITSTIPLDNTIPQSNEGTEVMTGTITPSSANSTIMVEFDTQVGQEQVVVTSCALFKDSATGAFSASMTTNTLQNNPTQIRVIGYVAAGSTSAATMHVRCGNSAGGTSYINSLDTLGQAFGGVSFATLTMTEILP